MPEASPSSGTGTQAHRENQVRRPN